jgi:ketosteroid isomerase-like protein
VFTEDAVRIPPHAATQEGKQKIRRHLKAQMDQSKVAFSASIKELKVSGNRGILRGDYSLTYTPFLGVPEGYRTPIRTGDFRELIIP